MHFLDVSCIVAGIALLLVAFWLPRRRESAENSRATAVPSNASINHALKLQNSLNELVRELQTLSQEVTGELEGKLGRLKDLLQLADIRCEQLSSAAPENEEEDIRHDGPREEEPDFSDSELELTVEEDEPPPMPANRYQQIYRLADEGCSLDEIARYVQMGKGEIQLILSLRKKD